jgi:exosortase A
MSDQVADSTHAEHETDEVAAPGPWDGLRMAAPALILGLLALAGLFWDEIVAAVTVWEGSTAYGHCFFVLPIALYLAWDRKESLTGLVPQPLPWLALLTLPLGAAWFFAERLGITEGRQLVMMTMVELLFLSVLGWRFAWALSAPLLYLYFLVPFGAFLTPQLQNITAYFIPIGLRLAGIPFYMDAFQIEIPEGSFYVAEACAGLRFLIASVAFGVLYACLIYRTLWKRALFMLASIIIPIVANGIRAFGIVWLGHFLGSAEAAAADHIVYGWLFFSFVIILLILAGMPFREDDTPLPAPEPDPIPEEGFGAALRPLRAAALLAAFAAVAPAGTMLLESRVAPPANVAIPQFIAPPGCTPSGEPVITPAQSTQSFACGGIPLIATIRLLPPRVNPNRIAVAWRQLTAEDTATNTDAETFAPPQPGSAVWRITTTEDPGWVTASAFWLDGTPSGRGLRDRARQAKLSMLGATRAPVLASVSYHSGNDRVAPRERTLADKLIRTFVAAQPNFDARMVEVSEAAGK